MNLAMWLTAGAAIAVLASFKALALSRQRLLVNAMFSGLGALAAGSAVVPAGQWLSTETDWAGVAAAALGALALLGVARLHIGRDNRS